MHVSATTWRKSSHSGPEYNCVEAASFPGAVALRDSKDPDGPKLVLDPTAWHILNADIKAGRYDLRRSS
ncbi:hypothetical protein Acsp04_37560 [Actinomadura sp. NBRC 104425]|uniref:DUF397 domain-containing protein n=1 Tax=Actinomadura sp. NBRC 104425 TaxID=3032204 RepID=UPI0024A02B90|nr:DUF397 domain-containing protein [Actinomadura sp. NBRC 104425]GLZ13521.1 hypothetical protein Acsp04_37560 [Actinomadura sp. NBRC 104425]